MSLDALVDIALEEGPVAEIASAVAEGGARAAVSPSIRPFLLAALARSAEGSEGRPLIAVVPDDRGAAEIARELATWLPGRRVRHYPSRGTGLGSHLSPPPHLVGLRIAALDALTGWRPGEPAPVVVASAVALTERVPEAELRPGGFGLARGEEVDLADVAELLADAGYERVEQVTERGEFAVRGGILDVFGATSDRAARIELFGDEIESIRWFSTFTQRSLGEAERVDLDPAAELAAEHRELAEIAAADQASGGGEASDAGDGDEGSAPAPVDLAELLPLERFRAPLDLIGERARIVLVGAEEIDGALADLAEEVEATIHDAHAEHLYVPISERLSERVALRVLAASEGDVAPGDAAAAAGSGEASPEGLVLRAQVPASAARSFREAEGELERELGSGYRVGVTFDHAGEAERVRYGAARVEPRLGQAGGAPPGEGELHFYEAHVATGFVAPQLKLAVIPYRRLVHRRRAAEPAPAAARLASFSELRVGDIVVHADHGIARFTGFETKTVAGVTRDYVELSYRGDDRVFAPTDQLAKITRYIGAGGDEPELSALGSKRWEGMKARARRAARELAGELLNLYAERRARRGHAFSADGEWMMELERDFPFRETADQLEAIEAVAADMESERPMDRLICGDVGYGKTEVALRAAVKAVADGKQVMMLVPTTILAQQHLGTFRERLRDFPIEVEMVSRLRRPAETRAALAGFAEGKVDILIGTHRLLSRDVRGRDLGLLVVDEEQRFGVRQKELLRQLKLRLDVLSMSATPIPRTLQMSLAGLRDISVIETPPEGRRPVRTFIGPYDEELVARAIERERERGGQAFYLHNRIETLHETAERLRGLCPEARFAEAHGRMDERELESTMLDFVRGETDCLVATTIIESGLDVPQANTLIVERSDTLGLAQAYQIRGRVGRSKERAYAYMLYPSRQALSREAAARLSALADHTELGQGFHIAMRDLELRGAGDLLGDEQSGHVAAVGFELYVSMLDDAVGALRAEREGEDAAAEATVRLDLDLSAYVPAEYVPFEAARIDVHRRIAAASEPADLGELAAELGDRFGDPPEAVQALIRMQRARIVLARAGATSAEVRGGRLSISGIELESAQVGAVRERVAEAMYERRPRTLSLRVEGEPGERLDALEALTGALDAVLADATREPDEATR